MTETVYEEGIVISAEPQSPFEEKIAERKTIVYETLVDVAVIRIAAENLKDQLFAKYGFLKTKPEDVTVISIDKYYTPYMMVSGKYAVDYYRKRTLKVKVPDDVSEVIVSIEKLKPTTLRDSFGEAYKGIELKSEERVKSEFKASLALDGLGRDVSLKELPSAPSEKNPEEVLAKAGTREVPADLDLSILRTRIFKRPTDMSWIDAELFEVNERLVIYVPTFKVTFKNTKTGQEKAVEFDGLAGKLIHKNT